MVSDISFTADHSLLQKIVHLGRRIGNTPLHPIQGVFLKKNVRIYAKKEWEQLSGSVKARAAFQIMRTAVANGDLHSGKILLDATSGNTGIAYATLARALNLRTTLCLPENASPIRKSLLHSLGVEIVYTSKFEGTDGAQAVAQTLAAQYPDRYFYADQYKNDNNWKAHFHHTAPEIFSAVPDITHFVAGLGTTGTFTGTGKRLKIFNPAVQLVALQPSTPMHGIEGWKHLETAVVPAIYEPTLADSMLDIATEDAYNMIHDAYRYEGLLLSPSAAANLVGAIKIAETLEQGIIVTVFPDNADKYREIIEKLITTG